MSAVVYKRFDMAKKIKNPEKKKAWDEFSRYVRMRDCLKTTGLPFVGICITCWRRFHISYLQAGHFIAGRRNAILFDERGTNAQCKWCNETKHGEPKKYKVVMIERYGKKKVDQMIIDAKKVIQDKDMDFGQITKTYRMKYEALLRKHGFKTYGELLKMGR